MTTERRCLALLPLKHRNGRPTCARVAEFRVYGSMFVCAACWLELARAECRANATEIPHRRP